MPFAAPREGSARVIACSIMCSLCGLPVKASMAMAGIGGFFIVYTFISIVYFVVFVGCSA